MPTPHCCLCGCNPQRPCRTIGRPFTQGDRQTGLTPGLPVNQRPVYSCRQQQNGRCSNCGHCGQCGEPLDGNAQLILVSGRKYRLCGSPRPCPGGDACDHDIQNSKSTIQNSCPVLLPPCRITYTGDVAFDTMIEALRFGTAEELHAAAGRWEQANPDPDRPHTKAMAAAFSA